MLSQSGTYLTIHMTPLHIKVFAYKYIFIVQKFQIQIRSITFTH